MRSGTGDAANGHVQPCERNDFESGRNDRRANVPHLRSVAGDFPEDNEPKRLSDRHGGQVAFACESGKNRLRLLCLQKGSRRALLQPERISAKSESWERCNRREKLSRL